jgi:hypothetical protein
MVGFLEPCAPDAGMLGCFRPCNRSCLLSPSWGDLLSRAHTLQLLTELSSSSLIFLSLPAAMMVFMSGVTATPL